MVLYLPGGVILEGTNVYEPVIAGKTLLGVLKNGVFHSVQTDIRGTPALTPYSPYGVREGEAVISPVVLDYTQKSFDPALKTVRMGVRDYAPELGSFAQPDLAVFLEPNMCLKSVVDCTLFSYGNNNPVIFTDPTGQAATYLHIFSFAADVAPITSTAMNISRVTFGSDPITGEQINTIDRVTAAGWVAVDVATGGFGAYAVRTGIKIGTYGIKAAHSAARSAYHTYKLTQLAAAEVRVFAKSVNLESKIVESLIQGAKRSGIGENFHVTLKGALRMSNPKNPNLTILGRDFMSHSTRNNNAAAHIWGPVKGTSKEIADTGFKHFKEIIEAPGTFNLVQEPKSGAYFWEKMLSDGRGLRLQQDFQYKGLIDPINKK